MDPNCRGSRPAARVRHGEQRRRPTSGPDSLNLKPEFDLGCRNLEPRRVKLAGRKAIPFAGPVALLGVIDREKELALGDDAPVLCFVRVGLDAGACGVGRKQNLAPRGALPPGAKRRTPLVCSPASLRQGPVGPLQPLVGQVRPCCPGPRTLRRANATRSRYPKGRETGATRGRRTRRT